MKNIFKEGYSRYVFVLPYIVIKIPSFRSYIRFLKGVYNNQSQWNIYRRLKNKTDFLCPVYFNLFGLILIMPVTKLMYDGEDGIDENWLDRQLIIDEDNKIPAETKIESYGWLNNKLVVFDYHE